MPREISDMAALKPPVSDRPRKGISGKPANFSSKTEDPVAVRDGSQEVSDRVRIRKLSPMPGDTPSEYFKFNLRSPKTLDIAFTHALEPAGSFDFGFLYDGSSKSVLYLNTTDMDYYQNGIPGVTRSIEETVSWIQAIKATFGFEVVRTIGQSMGGYAALVFGDLCMGLTKPIVFGFIISTVGCYQGLRVKGGTEGVARATITAFVESSVTVLVVDLFLTRLLLYAFHL